MAETYLDMFTRVQRRIVEILLDYGPLQDADLVARVVDATADDFEEFPPNVGAGDAVEILVLQSEFSQATFTPGDPRVVRTQTYPLILTGGSLRPTRVNIVKEHALDALAATGAKLGLAQQGVVSWSVSGRDAMTAEKEAPGADADRVAFRFKSIGAVQVTWLRPIARVL